MSWVRKLIIGIRVEHPLQIVVKQLSFGYCTNSQPFKAQDQELQPTKGPFGYTEVSLFRQAASFVGPSKTHNVSEWSKTNSDSLVLANSDRGHLSDLYS